MVANLLDKWKKEGKYVGKFATQHHFFGYEGRCAAPSNFDADYCYALGSSAAQLIANGKTGYMAIVKNTTAGTDNWMAGGVPITMMMNMEKRAGEMKPVIRKALVELDGKPFKAFAAMRDKWARETCFVYPGPIQYWGRGMRPNNQDLAARTRINHISNRNRRASRPFDFYVPFHR